MPLAIKETVDADPRPGRFLLTGSARAELYHYRTRDNAEVDLILENRLLAGIVLYTGQQTLPFGPRFRAMPVAAIWEVSLGESA